MENKIIVRKYEEKRSSSYDPHLNEVVEDGVAFPQEECLMRKPARSFFAAQTSYGGSREQGERTGLGIIYSSSEQ